MADTDAAAAAAATAAAAAAAASAAASVENASEVKGMMVVSIGMDEIGQSA